MSEKITKQELNNMYHKKGMTLSEIGSKIGLSDGGVYYYFKKHKIEVKDKSLSNETFIDRLKKYNPKIEALEKYQNMKTKIKFKCKICGNIWATTPHSVVNQMSGCNICAHNGYTPKMYKNKINKDTNSEYQVLGKYVNGRIKILYKHNKCGTIFNISPNSFRSGQRCPKCSGGISQEEYEEKVKEVHGDEYKILSSYNGVSEKISVQHIICGNKFKVRAGNLIYNKTTCRKCYINTRRFSHKEFVDKVNSITDDYEVLGKYKNSYTKVLMRHKKCGYEWKTYPSQFLNQGTRCPNCISYNNSKGVKKIKKYLKKRKIKFEIEYTFEDCKNINKLYYDFAIFDKEDKLICLIEYDGKQHFKPISYFGGEKEYKKRKKRDEIKTIYCKKNKIKLIRIPYYKKNKITQILSEKL